MQAVGPGKLRGRTAGPGRPRTSAAEPNRAVRATEPDRAEQATGQRPMCAAKGSAGSGRQASTGSAADRLDSAGNTRGSRASVRQQASMQSEAFVWRSRQKCFFKKAPCKCAKQIKNLKSASCKQKSVESLCSCKGSSLSRQWRRWRSSRRDPAGAACPWHPRP